jgi:hypothetical protein
MALHRKSPVVTALLALLLLSLTAYFGFKARNETRQYEFIGVPIERNTISVSGEGKVTAIPDIATIDLGTTTERQSVAAAQKENTRIMNELNAKLSGFGVDKKDVQTTNYNIYPAYDYIDGRSKLRGYTVSQNVRVKVRDLDKLGDIIGAAGETGANQVGGISFTVDEPEQLRQEARIEALENAKMKADALARVVGVKLRRVVSFEESGGGLPPTPRYYALEKADLGLGYGGAPEIEAGSTEITVTATVTYEIE